MRRCVRRSGTAAAPAGLLIKEKNLKKAKAMVLHFIAQEDPAFGRSSIKQNASAGTQEAFEMPNFSGAPPVPCARRSCMHMHARHAPHCTAEPFLSVCTQRCACARGLGTALHCTAPESTAQTLGSTLRSTDAGLKKWPDTPIVLAGQKKRFKKPSMRAGRAVDSDEAANALSLFEDVDLSCLHRCLHVQDMLGDREA
jgi:hypothetical protein